MQLFSIYYLIPFIVALFAQFVKLIIDMATWKKIHASSFFTSWGMPSAHSTLTSSLVTMVILLEWLESTLTMTVIVYALLVRYDAANVRYESWKHAQYINTLRKQMHEVMTETSPSQHHVNNFRHFGLLKERLGHTPVEVIIWILFWFSVTLVFVWFCNLYIINLR